MVVTTDSRVVSLDVLALRSMRVWITYGFVVFVGRMISSVKAEQAVVSCMLKLWVIGRADVRIELFRDVGVKFSVYRRFGERWDVNVVSEDLTRPFCWAWM